MPWKHIYTLCSCKEHASDAKNKAMMMCPKDMWQIIGQALQYKLKIPKYAKATLLPCDFRDLHQSYMQLERAYVY